MRAASADRERAVDVLKAGFAEGRLTQDEYNDRMGRAYAARTYGEHKVLGSLVHHLEPSEQGVVMIENRFALDEHRVAELSGMPVDSPYESGCPLSVRSDLPTVLQGSRHSMQRFRRPQSIGIPEKSVTRGQAPSGARIDGESSGVRIQA